MPARKAHELLAHEVRMRGHALLVEEVTVDAVRVALHVERPPADVVERAACDVDVVLDEIALRQPALGEEELVRVGDRDLVAAESHWRRKLRVRLLKRAKPAGANTDGRRECREGEFEGNSRGAGFFSMYPIRFLRLPLKGDFGGDRKGVRYPQQRPEKWPSG